MVARGENNRLLFYKKKKDVLCTTVFLMCERDLAKALLDQRHSVMKYICNIIRFSTLSCVLVGQTTNHYYDQTGNVGSQSAWLPGFR